MTGHPLAAQPFHAMAKPVGAACNLDCRYCYYLRREGAPASRRMSSEVLAAFVRDTLAAHAGLREVQFSWQGGEPLLAGIDFFREALALQERHRPSGVHVVNALQTNGTLIDERWAEFFAQQRFLVGISLDGPVSFHDRLRRDTEGRATHARALRGLALLQRHGVEFNTLTVVHHLNHRHGLGVYRFLRRIGVRHMQFIPLVERADREGALAPPWPADRAAEPAPWTVPAEGYGRFLCEVFDEWLAHDVGTVFVSAFEERIAALAGHGPGTCVFATDCRGTPMLEADGSLYSCDHYAYPAWRLGNVSTTPVGALVQSDRQGDFGRAKSDSLPGECLRCEYLTGCAGGCPKHRFVATPDGHGVRSWLCPSYRLYFRHTNPALSRFAALAQARP